MTPWLQGVVWGPLGTPCLAHGGCGPAWELNSPGIPGSCESILSHSSSRQGCLKWDLKWGAADFGTPPRPPPRSFGARGKRSKGAAPSVSLSLLWLVPDLALPLCCDCRPQGRRDRSRPPGRKGRIPHWDRYTPTLQAQGGHWHGHGRGPHTLSPCWSLRGCWALPGCLGTAGTARRGAASPTGEDRCWQECPVPRVPVGWGN